VSDETADTIPAPNANTEELARELDKLAFRELDSENLASLRGDTEHANYCMGWKAGVREAAEFVRTKGAVRTENAQDDVQTVKVGRT
jgi:hypothetical protein